MKALMGTYTFILTLTTTIEYTSLTHVALPLHCSMGHGTCGMRNARLKVFPPPRARIWPTWLKVRGRVRARVRVRVRVRVKVSVRARVRVRVRVMIRIRGRGRGRVRVSVRVKVRVR